MLGISRDRRIIYWIAFFFSLLLSYWANVKEVVINADAICYLQSAESIPQGLNFVSHLCDQSKWPFYPVLIYSIASFTQLSFLNAASLLDGLLSFLSVASFIAIITFLKGSPRTIVLAAIVILMDHAFNSTRVYIIRDHGYWAFYLLSILFLLHFFRSKSWRSAIAWNISLIIATLFRIEGCIFLVFLPWLSLFNSYDSYRVRGQAFLKLYSPLLFTGLIAGLWFSFHPAQISEYLGRIHDLEFQVLHGFNTLVQNFLMRARTLVNILSKYTTTNEMSLILFLVIINWYCIKLIANLSAINGFLIIYAWSKKALQLDKPEKLVLWSYILINVAITFIFLTEQMFLSKRYLLALSLTLLLWVPFALDKLCQQWPQTKWPLVVVGFLMSLYALTGIFDHGASKKYIHEAGDWLSGHMPPSAKLYSNDYHVMYYSQRFGNDIFTRGRDYINQETRFSSNWQQFDYVALRTTKHHHKKNEVGINTLGTPLYVFANKRGDAVSIYKIH